MQTAMQWIRKTQIRLEVFQEVNGGSYFVIRIGKSVDVVAGPFVSLSHANIIARQLRENGGVA